MSRSGAYIKQLSGYKAFIPNPLPPEPGITLNEELTEKLLRANFLIARLDGLGFTLPNTDLFISMYVKKEALLSSQIEGTQASLENLFEFESGMQIDNLNDVEQVVNYIKALNYGIKKLKTFPMSLRLIKEIHALVLHETRGKHKTPGEFKKTQNWIGSANSNLNNAIFVPPPADETIKAMGDLENYFYSENKIPELINCALIHYQFETIHPFLDGNGRVGRLLITFYLYWKNIIERPLLYLSYYFKKNRQEYYDRLMIVRNKGDYEQWINFFLDGVIETSEMAINDIKKILELQASDQKLLWEKKISSPLVVMVHNKLFYTPVITINEIEKAFDVSYPTASNVVNQLIKVGILQETTGQKRSKRYIYKKYMDILAQGTQI